MPGTDLHETISSALSGGALFAGGLLRTNEPSLVWRVTSQLPAQSLALFRREKDRAVVTSDVIGVDADSVCWVLGYQVADVQHRWVLPLAGAEVGSLVREVRKTGLRLWMDAGAEDTVFEVRMPVSREVNAALGTHWAPCVGSSTAGETLLRTAAQLLVPGSLKPAPGSQRARTVSVTAVVPADLRLDPASEAAAAIWRASRSARQGSHDA